MGCKEESGRQKRVLEHRRRIVKGWQVGRMWGGDKGGIYGEAGRGRALRGLRAISKKRGRRGVGLGGEVVMG